MMLGTLIKQAMRAQGPFAEEIAAQDPELAKRIHAAAGALDMNAPAYIADTVSRFMGAEDGESWTTVVSGIQSAEDPGLAFLEAVLRKRLSHRCEAQG
jgi:hypothetical protein